MKTLGRMRGALLVSGLVIIVITVSLVLVMVNLMKTTQEAGLDYAQSNIVFALAESALDYGASKVADDYSTCNNRLTIINNPKISDGAQYGYKCQEHKSFNNQIKGNLSKNSSLIPVRSKTGLAPAGQIIIGFERINYTGISENAAICGGGKTPCLIVGQRGANGTKAKSHASGSQILQLQFTITGEAVIPSFKNPGWKRTVTTGLIPMISLASDDDDDQGKGKKGKGKKGKDKSKSKSSNSRILELLPDIDVTYKQYGWREIFR